MFSVCLCLLFGQLLASPIEFGCFARVRPVMRQLFFAFFLNKKKLAKIWEKVTSNCCCKICIDFKIFKIDFKIKYL